MKKKADLEQVQRQLGLGKVRQKKTTIEWILSRSASNKEEGEIVPRKTGGRKNNPRERKQSKISSRSKDIEGEVVMTGLNG